MVGGMYLLLRGAPIGKWRTHSKTTWIGTTVAAGTTVATNTTVAAGTTVAACTTVVGVSPLRR